MVGADFLLTVGAFVVRVTPAFIVDTLTIVRAVLAAQYVDAGVTSVRVQATADGLGAVRCNTFSFVVTSG